MHFSLLSIVYALIVFALKSVCLHSSFGSKIGEIRALRFLVDVQLSDFRSFFGSLAAISQQTFPGLMKAYPECSRSYEHFLSSQGKSVRKHFLSYDCILI